MAEFIEVISESAIRDVQTVTKEVAKLVDGINKANTASRELKIPSDFRSSLNDLNTILRNNNILLRAQANLQQQIANSTNQSTQSINNNTQAEINAERVEQQRLRTQRERMRNQRLEQTEAERSARAAERLIQQNERLNSAYVQLSNQEREAARRVQDLIARGRTAEQTQRQYNRELRVAQREHSVLAQRVQAADRAVGRFNRNVGNYPRQAVLGIKDLISAFGVVGGVAAFAEITKNIFNTTKEIQSLDLALKQVINDSVELGQTQEFLSRIADAYGIEINGLTRAYTQFYVSAKDKLSGQQIQDIFESISKAAGAMGLTVEQQEGAFTALTQMLSKGNIQAEELRGQLSERLPGAFRILAESMGVTEVELNKLLKDGKVLAAEVLPAFAKQLEKAYNVETIDRVETLSAETSRLSNEWTEFVRSLSEGEGIVSRVLVWGVEQATKTLEGFTKGLKVLGVAGEKEFSVDELVSSAYSAELQKFQSQAYLSADALKEMASIELTSLTSQLDRLKEARKNIEGDNKGGIMNFLTGGASGQKATLKGLNENSDAQARLIGMINALNDIINGNVDVRKKQNEATKTGIELTDKERKEIERRAEEEQQNMYKLQKLRLEAQKNSADKLLENEHLYLNEREGLITEKANIELEIAKLGLEESLRLAKGNNTLRLIALEEFYKDAISITDKKEKDLLKAQEESYNDFKEYNEKFQNEGLRGQSTEGLVSIWEQQKDKEKEEAEKAKKQLREDIDDYLKTFTEGFFQDAGLPTLFKVLNDEIAGFGENWATTFNAITEIAQEALAFMTQNQQAYFDGQYSRLEREKELALKYAGENAAGQEEITRQFEERKREIRQREAKAQKETALFNAAINIAQGITAALAQGPPGIPLAVIIGALGAVQIAMIASRPMPEYKDGTANHPGGLMKVNDAPGSVFKERIVYPDGRTFDPQGRNVVLNAPKGTKVLKAGSFNNELEGMFNYNGILHSGLISNTPNINIDSSGGITPADLDKVMSKYTSQKTFNIHIDKNGLKASWDTQTTKNVITDNLISTIIKTS